MHNGTDVKYSDSPLICIYDGTFDGFLCCVFHAVYSRSIPAGISYEATLLPSRTIPTDAVKAERVARGIKEKISHAAFDTVRTAFRASAPDRELLLLRFLLLGFCKGGAVMSMLSHEAVAPVMKMEKAVRNEAHRMKEFVRFSDSGGALTAVIAPRHDVLELITAHFSDRLRGEKFLIWDETRGKAFVYENGHGGFLFADNIDIPAPGEEELAFRRLWKLFYDTVEIKERHNDRCRNTHLPKFYRKNMTEFKD